jgi:hypothetical protein
LEELVYAYAMTGDERWREWIEDWIRYLKDYSARDDFPTWLMSQNAGYTASWARSVWDVLQSLCVAAEFSGDPRLRAKADDLVRALIDLKEPTGVTPNIDIPFSEPYYRVRPVHLYDDLTGNKDALQAAQKLLDYNYHMAVDPENPYGANWAGDNADAYFLTRDPKYVAEGRWRMERAEPVLDGATVAISHCARWPLPAVQPDVPEVCLRWVPEIAGGDGRL